MCGLLILLFHLVLVQIVSSSPLLPDRGPSERVPSLHLDGEEEDDEDEDEGDEEWGSYLYNDRLGSFLLDGLDSGRRIDTDRSETAVAGHGKI